MKGKPRGSVTGLLKHRDNQKDLNTAAMLEALRQLQKEKPTSKWKYKDVWSRAGLQSPVSLNSPWNAHVRAEIDSHNQNLHSSGSQHSSLALSKEERDIVMRLREELKVCQAQRSDALMRLAQFAADADYYRNKCSDLERANERLKNRDIGSVD